MTDAVDAPPAAPTSFREALRFWARLGCISFGGPAAQIALMHEELVVRRRWLTADRFDHALDFCMLLPGPEAQQLATYSGWLLHGTRGGLAAGVLFVLPSAVLLFLLSWAYASWGSLGAVDGVLWGMKAVVVALVLEAALRVARRALRRPLHAVFATAAFALLYFFAVPFPLLVLSGAFGGLLLTSPDKNASPVPAAANQRRPRHSWPRVVRVLATGLLLWSVPLAVLLAIGEPVRLAEQQYCFFSGAALVTFGGAYAVLAYVSQAAVADFGWLTPMQAIDALALAETTPGPLIMVLQFLGFMAGWNHPGALSPFGAATLGAAVTTWATFLPSMVLLFLGAPWVEALRHHRAAARALAGVTAVVLGVLVNLAVVFGTAVLWPRSGGAAHFDGWAMALAVLAFVALATKRLSVLTTVLLGAAIGCGRAMVAP